MKKNLLLLLLFMSTISLANAEQIGEGIDIPTPPPPAEITPEKRWLTGDNWRKHINYTAENYRPERLKELARAIEFIDKRRATANLGKGDTQIFDYKHDSVDVNNPESVRDFINNKLKRHHDEAVFNAEVLNTGTVNVQ